MKVSEEIGGMFVFYVNLFLILVTPAPIALFLMLCMAMVAVATVYEVVATAIDHTWRHDPYFRTFVYYLLGRAA